MEERMPVINIDKLASLLAPDDLEIVSRIVGTRGDTKGRLRASKPPTKDDTGRLATYVWRMVAFEVSPLSAHHCMPCTVEFDLPRECWGPSGFQDHKAIHQVAEHRRQVTAHLDEVVKAVVDNIPRTQWHGIIRWGQAFGQIGMPQVASDGAIIYR